MESSRMTNALTAQVSSSGFDLSPPAPSERTRLEAGLSREERDYLRIGKKSHVVWEGEGCKECRGTGYKGRTGIFEVLDMNDRVKAMVTGSVELADLVSAAQENGLESLRQVAIRKMLEGATTYEEVISMTG